MAKLNILEFPDPRLRTVAEPVTEINDEIRKIVDDMFETMYDAPGIGLAATQVDIHLRIVTMDLSDEQDDPMVMVNPTFEVLDETPYKYQEGCLSVPGYYEDVVRPQHIRVTALDRNGEEFSFEAQDLLAICVQHELDHLNGKLFVDHISTLKRNRIRTKLEKKHRLEAQA